MGENPKANPGRQPCRENKDGRKANPGRQPCREISMREKSKANLGRQPYRENKGGRKPSVIRFLGGIEPALDEGRRPSVFR
jgi:hypothetical protein